MSDERLSQDKPSVALIGYRGSGKTTVGRALAARLGKTWVDTDERIEKLASRSIAEIFATGGEDAFRGYEREVIQAAVEGEPAVISVGGGAVMDEANVDVLRTVAQLIWLTAPASELMRRIHADARTASTRPPLTGLAREEEDEYLLVAREPYYRRAADLSIGTEGRSAEEVAAEIARRIG